MHDSDAVGAIRHVAPASGRVAMVRSWMLRVERYVQLYHALLTYGVRLLNDPAAYCTCHELPSAYPYIAEHTPAAV